MAQEYLTHMIHPNPAMLVTPNNGTVAQMSAHAAQVQTAMANAHSNYMSPMVPGPSATHTVFPKGTKF